MSIHPSAIVAEGAVVPESCTVGPFCVLGPEVTLGEGCELISHVVIEGRTTLGARNRVSPFTTIGIAPQDLKYHDEPTGCTIGDDNTIREFITISRGTVGGGGMTRIGSNCLFMAYCHIAHDCVVGDNVIMANQGTLAGHVTVEDWAIIGAMSPVHQFCRVGKHAYIGGGTITTQDVMPFSLISAKRDNKAYGLNKVGLARRGFTPEQIRELSTAMRLLTNGKKNTTQALEAINDMLASGAGDEHVKYLAEFVASSERGVIK